MTSKWQDYISAQKSILKNNQNFGLKRIRNIFQNVTYTKKQRDELINDMAEIKKKAEAWDKQKDELREMVTFCYMY